MLGLTFTGILAIALTLPIEESALNQILTLLGLVISGIIAFSSGTIFANLMAGLMLRVTKPFSTGDFIDVKGYFGRVVERGLLDTEIQTENRELVAIPNTAMITNPISVTHGSGAIVSTTLSLGYDIHHSVVDTLLLDAAQKSGLEDPFVQVLDIGDYSVTYKASGKLTDTKNLLTARSNLCRYVLDGLHGAGIEIVSPAFMNQRKLSDDLKIIPAKVNVKVAESNRTAEEIIFDKAEKAQQKENSKQQLVDTYQAYKQKLETADGENKGIIQKKIDNVLGQLKEIEQLDIEAEKVDDRPVNRQR